jgi:hypothetical protein
MTKLHTRPPGEHEREEWRRPVEDFEWAEEHLWILPPEERWDAMERSRATLVHRLKERAFDLAARRMAPGHA